MLKYGAFRQGGNGIFIEGRVARFSATTLPFLLPAKVLSFGDSLTSVSLHAHIYKNTVKTINTNLP
jgi:hypothetical protein